jgi:hypothetical protein
LARYGDGRIEVVFGEKAVSLSSQSGCAIDPEFVIWVRNRVRGEAIEVGIVLQSIDAFDEDLRRFTDATVNLDQGGLGHGFRPCR